MFEIWKPIIHFEGLYSVSNLGRIMSLDRYVGLRKLHKKERILRPAVDECGYLRVALSKDNRLKSFRVHRLVATSFIPNPENKPDVNHIDANKLNNSVTNLEWNTEKENVVHAFRNNLYPIKRGLSHHNAKRVAQIDNSGNIITLFESANEAGTVFGISSSLVSRVCSGQLRKTHGLEFKYISTALFKQLKK